MHVLDQRGLCARSDSGGIRSLPVNLGQGQVTRVGKTRTMSDPGAQGKKRKTDSQNGGDTKRSKPQEGHASTPQSEGRMSALKALLASKIGPLPPRKESSNKPKQNGTFQKPKHGASFARNKMGHGKPDHRHGGKPNFKPKGHGSYSGNANFKHQSSFSKPGYHQNNNNNNWKKIDKGGDRRQGGSFKPSPARQGAHQPARVLGNKPAPKSSDHKSPSAEKSSSSNEHAKAQHSFKGAAKETHVKDKNTAKEAHVTDKIAAKGPHATAAGGEADNSASAKLISLAAKMPKVSSNWLALSQQLKEEKKAKVQEKNKSSGGGPHEAKKDTLPRGGQSAKPGYIVPLDAKNMHIDAPIAIDCEMVGVGE
jgi:hypothetical protein